MDPSLFVDCIIDKSLTALKHFSKFNVIRWKIREQVTRFSPSSRKPSIEHLSKFDIIRWKIREQVMRFCPSSRKGQVEKTWGEKIEVKRQKHAIKFMNQSLKSKFLLEKSSHACKNWPFWIQKEWIWVIYLQGQICVAPKDVLNQVNGLVWVLCGHAEILLCERDCQLFGFLNPEFLNCIICIFELLGAWLECSFP